MKIAVPQCEKNTIAGRQKGTFFLNGYVWSHGDICCQINVVEEKVQHIPFK